MRDFHGRITSTSGTNVTVINLFGDMPVRVKQRANDTSASLKEWDDLKKQAAALLLCCSSTVTVELRDTESMPPRKAKISAGKDQQPSRSKPAQPRITICSLLYQAGFISSPHTSSWVNVAGSTSKLELQGAICLDPVPTKNIQFISIGITPIMNDEGHNVLYECINKIFARSLFGVVDDLPELDAREKKRRAEDRRFKTDGYTNKELKSTCKGVDRWPMFALRIEIKDLPLIGRLHSTDDIFEDNNALASITSLLQQVAVGFLTENKLMPKNVPKQKSPTKRDRYGNPIQRDEYNIQPRQVSSDTPRKKLQSTPASTVQSPGRPAHSNSPFDGAVSAPITRTASPFDIWPRVKSGRTMNAPAVPKPASPTKKATAQASSSRPAIPLESGQTINAANFPESAPTRERTASPTFFTRPRTPYESIRTVCPTPPPRPLSPPTVSKSSALTSSHFSKTESIISKKGTVLALPFQDIGANTAACRDRAASLTEPKLVLPAPLTTASRTPSVLEDYLAARVSYKTFRSSTEMDIARPQTLERPQSAPETGTGENCFGVPPIKNCNRSPERGRGLRREPPSSWHNRTESCEGGYRHDLHEYLEEHQRVSRGSPKRAKSRAGTQSEEAAAILLQMRTPLPNAVPKSFERHTAPPRPSSVTKALPQPSLMPTPSARQGTPLQLPEGDLGQNAVTRALDARPDDTILYKDINGKGSYINKRTGQTLANPIIGNPSRHSPRKDRLSRRLPSSASNNDAAGIEERKMSAFVMSVLKDHKSTAFKPITEPAIPQISSSSTSDSDVNAILHGHKHNCSHTDIDKAFKSSAGNGGEIRRLSKEGLRNGTVIQQVDNKFVLIKVPEATGQVLVLIDQHAADERIRIEGLLSDYFKPEDASVKFEGLRAGYPAGGLKVGVKVELLATPIHFDISTMEAHKLRIKQQYFAGWGICFALRKGLKRDAAMVVVTALPPGIVERCKLEPKLAIDLIRKELYASLEKPAATTTITCTDVITTRVAADDEPRTTHVHNDWLERVHNIPQGVLDMLDSRACRSAIMFNDSLSLEECKALVDKLARTRFPFICAHGRPSMVPLVETGVLGGYEDQKAMEMADWMTKGGGDGWEGKEMRNLWVE